jgi:hypothetical protein
MKEDFKAGDILICKKAIDSEHQFVPRIQMIQGAEYRVSEVLARYISIVMNNTKDFIETKNKDYFSIGESLPYTDKRSYSAWDKWFYTKSELREMKLKELGI